MIKVCAFSDGHGILPKIEEEFDLMLIGGDNVNLYCQSSKSFTKEWYLKNFVEWVNTLPMNIYSKILVISGNHEIGMQMLSNNELKSLWDEIYYLTNGHVVYLQNELYEYCKSGECLKIFGTPYCKQFGNWAYMEDQETLRNLYSKIPENIDILLSHDAPYGCSDMCFGWFRKPEHIGNIALRNAILDKNPKFCIHGHLHSANHECEMLYDTKVYCVSLVDESYNLAYEPLYLDI